MRCIAEKNTIIPYPQVDIDKPRCKTEFEKQYSISAIIGWKYLNSFLI
jgi:hypothetical protein